MGLFLVDLVHPGFQQGGGCLTPADTERDGCCDTGGAEDERKRDLDDGIADFEVAHSQCTGQDGQRQGSDRSPA